MKEKIDWYQEVLELEPGSKVFFPLARLLADAGQIERSIQTLRHGLDRHPEFIEARLYLIDLLFRSGQQEQSREEVGQLSGLFSRYDGFWQAWGSSLTGSGKDRDAGLALTFLAAAFQMGSLSLSDVLAKGLQATLNQGAPLAAQPADAPSTATIPAAAAPVAPSVSLTQSGAADPLRQGEEGAEGSLVAASVAAVLAPLAQLAQALPKGPRVGAADAAAQASPAHLAQGADTTQSLDTALPLSAEDQEESEERFSLRTRSMAEVLAEQGDYAGALEIYQELSALAATPEEAADLQYRISTLSAHLGAVHDPCPEPDLGPAPVSGASPTGGKHRVLTVLEALAERLENRVHG